MKKRLDVLMFEKGLAQSRERAKSLVMSGTVYVGENKAQKPGEQVEEDAVITIKEKTCPFVSRGGLKLQKAVDEFSLDLQGLVCADIGASTGGFTDCMLQQGANKVYAVEVGYGQLDWSLRNDERVCVMERTNARFLTKENFGESVSFASCDVSFISLKLIIPALKLCEIPRMVTLIKPQFEAGRDKVGKNGVVRDAKTHIQVITDILDFAKSQGYSCAGLVHSPIKGPKGNIEFVTFFTQECVENDVDIQHVVASAHAEL